MDQIEQSIRRMVKDHITLASRIEETIVPNVRTATDWFVETLKKGNKILFAGNGGSAADSQHLAAELIGRFAKERMALPAIALTTDTSSLTAIGNDYGYHRIFSRQIEGLAQTGDLFVAISTSGNSENLVDAAEKCHERSVKTIGFLGNDGGKLGKRVDLPIIVDSTNTARIQEMHILIGHMICELVENEWAVQSSE